MNKIKKFIKSNSLAIGAFALALIGSASLTIGNIAHAAADPDLVNAVASGTSAITDNKTPMINWVVYCVIAGFIITLIFIALRKGLGMIKVAFGGGSRRKR